MTDVAPEETIEQKLAKVEGTGNKNVVLVTGVATAGKTTSLMNMPQQENIAYFNTDLKELTFQTNMQVANIKEPTQVLDGVAQVETLPHIHTGVIDTITHLMRQFESQHINAPHVINTQKAWGAYGTFYTDLLHAIKAGTKNYVVFTHEADKLNEKEMVLETKAPIKGAVGKVGIESDFSIVLSAKRLPLKKVAEWSKDNELLHITEEDQENGFKYVFATRIDSETVGEKTRSPIGLWKRSEKYIDNDLNLVFRRLNEYYG